MNYLAAKSRPTFEFFTSIEGEVKFPLAAPSEDIAPMRRVLDAAHPQAAQWLVTYLRTTYRPEHKRRLHKRAMAGYLTWLDGEHIGLMQARPSDLARYLTSLTGHQPAATIHRHLATIRGFYQYLNGRL